MWRGPGAVHHPRTGGPSSARAGPGFASACQPVRGNLGSLLPDVNPCNVTASNPRIRASAAAGESGEGFDPAAPEARSTAQPRHARCGREKVGRDREGGHAARPTAKNPLPNPYVWVLPCRGADKRRTAGRPARARERRDPAETAVVGGAGPREAGGPHGPRHRQRVGSQGGMPTRSSPEAGLAGDEF